MLCVLTSKQDNTRMSKQHDHSWRGKQQRSQKPRKKKVAGSGLQIPTNNSSTTGPDPRQQQLLLMLMIPPK